MIDPATAVLGGSGFGMIAGLALKFMRSKGENELAKLKEINRHAEKNNNATQEHQQELNSGPLDKGEPYNITILWGLWKSSGTRPDRRIPHVLSREFFMLTAAYCWAVFVCFACGDTVIIERPIEGDPNVFEAIFGIIRYTSSGARVYVQTLAGLGSGLIATASVILTTTFIGIYDSKR